MIVNCCCNCHVSPAPVLRWENITKVADWAYDPNPDGIAPYTRRWFEIQDGSCLLSRDEPNATCGREGTALDPGYAQPVCHDQGFDRSVPATDWDVPGIKPCGGAGFVSKVIDNCYRRMAETVSFNSQCKKSGWKGVQAKAVWPGAVGFSEASQGCCPDGGQGQVRYLTIRSNETAIYSRTTSTSNACDGAAPTTITFFYKVHADQACHCDRYGNLRRTGRVTVEIWTSQNGVKDPGEINSCDLEDATGWVSTQFVGGKLFPGAVPFSANCGVIVFGSGVDALVGTVADLNAAEHYKTPPDDTQLPCDDPLNPGLGATTTGSGQAAVFSLSETEISVSYNSSVSADSFKCCAINPSGADAHWDESISYQKTVTLSDPLSYTSVLADVYSLLDEWPLNDDAVYPWRQDDGTWLQPLVSRDAEASVPTINWATGSPGTAGECVFLDEIHYSGEIRGSPMPAGYDAYFNFHQIVWGAGQAPGSWCGACQLSIGELSPLPSATQWTDKYDGASMKGPGAWLINIRQGQYGPAASDPPSVIAGVWAQKWAETLDEWPAINFARPCARDRYFIDETNVACLSSYAAPDVVLDVFPSFTEFDIGDIIAMPDGVFEITGKTDATHYAVGSKKYDNLVPLDGSDFAKLRFPTARAICGRLAVTASQQSVGVVLITVPEKHWLKRGGTDFDTVDFHSVAGLGSGLTATVVSDTSFTVPGTLGAYSGGGYVSSAGITSGTWDWDTTCSRHEAIFRSWQSQYREAYFNPLLPPAVLTETQISMSPSSTHPTVLCISPNTRDVFPHGMTFGPFSGFGIIEFDYCFGEEWHADFQQAIADPFWQPDHEPCSHIGLGTWTQAPQPCSKTEDEYDFPPMVEARLATPGGAPTIPVTLHVQSGLPGYIGHPNCVIDPYGRATVHFYRDAWLTCTDWKEKIRHRC